jgi:hypothetical protein
MTSTFPKIGKITDMEKMSSTIKQQFLQEHKAWKCQYKTEMLDEHNSTWTKNGLSSLRYTGNKRER